MLIEKFEIGQRFFQASLLKYGKDVDNSMGDCFTTREEAEADGAEMAHSYDPEWQKKYPGVVEYVVTEWEVTDIDADGQWSGVSV